MDGRYNPPWFTTTASRSVDASINIIRESPALSRTFHRILYRSVVQKARVAAAPKMAIIIYVMLRDREPFQVQPA